MIDMMSLMKKRQYHILFGHGLIPLQNDLEKKYDLNCLHSILPFQHLILMCVFSHLVYQLLASNFPFFPMSVHLENIP